jgi:hypothetical protein
MLEAIRDSLDGLTEQEQAHYKEKDGKFYLDVGPVGTLALEDVGGLKRTLETLKGEERKLKEKIQTIQTQYDGIDAGEARIALSKYQEIKDFDVDGKVAEAVEAQKRDLVANHQRELEKITNDYNEAVSQLDDAIGTSVVVEALQKEGGNVELLKPHVMGFIKMKRGADGKRYPEVIGSDGVPRVGDGAGNPMSILQLVQEMKTQDVFASAFNGAGSTGSGSPPAGSPGSGNRTNVVPTSGNVVVASGNLEDIATGKTQVKMSG